MRLRYATALAVAVGFGALTWALAASRDRFEPVVRMAFDALSGQAYGPDDYVFALLLSGLMAVAIFGSLAWSLFKAPGENRRIDRHLAGKHATLEPRTMPAPPGPGSTPPHLPCEAGEGDRAP